MAVANTAMPAAGAVCHLLLLLLLQLPDGNEIQVGVDRFKVPELLFQPVSTAGFHDSRMLCLLCRLLPASACCYIMKLPNVSGSLALGVSSTEVSSR
jgi:hypothetical protein